jgi:hypothetical protein
MVAPVLWAFNLSTSFPPLGTIHALQLMFCELPLTSACALEAKVVHAVLLEVARLPAELCSGLQSNRFLLSPFLFHADLLAYQE